MREAHRNQAFIAMPRFDDVRRDITGTDEFRAFVSQLVSQLTAIPQSLRQLRRGYEKSFGKFDMHWFNLALKPMHSAGQIVIDERCVSITRYTAGDGVRLDANLDMDNEGASRDWIRDTLGIKDAQAKTYYESGLYK